MKIFKPSTASFFRGFALVAILVAVRAAYTDKFAYLFLLWNLFLAFIPWLISSMMEQRPKLGILAWSALFGSWLLFFPNAPYMVTDLMHLRWRGQAPVWFDVAMVFTAALTALSIGCASLFQMERLWAKRFPAIHPGFMIVSVLLLCGFGIYLGRELRFNSWDLLTDPFSLARVILKRVLYPWNYVNTWRVTLLFATITGLAYWQLRPVKLNEPG